MLDLMPDWDRTRARFEAWWNNDMLDRPVVQLACPRAAPRQPLRPAGETLDVERLFTDAEYAVDVVENDLARTEFCGDAIPAAGRGLGTGYLALFAGAPVNCGESTVWIDPFIEDWETVPRPAFDPALPVHRKLQAVAEALAENARGRYLLVHPDYLDAVTVMSQMRGVERLCLDLMDDPGPVLAYRDELVRAWLNAYEYWYAFDQTRAPGGSLAWPGTYAEGRGGCLQCDFSYMISPGLFKRFVFPELSVEGEHLDRTIYHLDGKGSVVHLPRLLEMPGITAIQWVPGDGAPTAAEDPAVVKAVQKGGKPVQLSCFADELEALFEVLDPRGVMFRVRFRPGDHPTREMCGDIVRRIERWASGRR